MGAEGFKDKDLQTSRTMDPPLCGQAFHSPPARGPLEGALNTISPNFGFKSTDVHELPMIVIKPDLFWPSRMEENVEKIVTLDRKPTS